MNIRSLFLILLIPFASLAQLAIPEHGGVWVHDEANVLSAGAKAELEAILKYERDSTSNQIAILIVQSIQGESLEEYALRVAEKWQLGQKSKDNGALFIIALNERQMRIEAGRGLEGVLTDAMSSRINRNEVAPYFRQGNYDEGVKAGVMAIIHVIKGEYKNDEPPARKKSRKNSPLTTLIVIIIILIVAARRNRGGRGGGGYWSSGGGFMGPTGGFGGSSGSWGSGGGSDFGGGGGFSGGGSSDSW
jgi:uncharacterized protein